MIFFQTSGTFLALFLQGNLLRYSVFAILGLVVLPLSAQSDGTLIYQFNGTADHDFLGHSVASAGDVDGDGVPDIIVGAPETNPGGNNEAGSAYIYSGSTGALIYQLDGYWGGNQFGNSVAGVGDVNSDGFDDVIVGAWKGNPNGTSLGGSAFVYSGATGALLYQFNGQWDHTYFGSSVAGGGDMNGDGVPDIIIGAYLANYTGYDSGSVFVYSGSDGALLYRFDGETGGDRLGGAVANAGDVDGDGVADILAGATQYGNSEGAAYVYSGASGSTIHSFYGASWVDWFGNSVSGAGDVDGDGLDDLIIGAHGADYGGTNSGAAYVFSGGSGNQIHRFDGPGNSAELGAAVAGLGDVDGDGFPDFLIGADHADPFGNTQAGTVYIYSGLSGAILHEIHGDTAFDRLGNSVSALGDVNGDGYLDIFVGSERNDPAGLTNAGSAFVFSLAPDAPTLALTGACPGSITVDITGVIPNGSVALAYGPAGSFTVPNGPCAGIILGISSPTLAGIYLADASGDLNFSTPPLPSSFCGLTVQAVDVGTCLVSNSVIIP